jgi:hypothetical protein
LSTGLIIETICLTVVPAAIVVYLLASGRRSMKKEAANYVSAIVDLAQNMGFAVRKREIYKKGYVTPEDAKIKAHNYIDLTYWYRITEAIIEFFGSSLDGVILTRFSKQGGASVQHFLEFIVAGELIQEYQNRLNPEIPEIEGFSTKKELKKEKRKRAHEAKSFYQFETSVSLDWSNKFQGLSWEGEERLTQALNADNSIKNALSTLRDNNPKIDEIMIGYVSYYKYTSIKVIRFLPSREDLEMFNRIAQHTKKVWLTKN